MIDYSDASTTTGSTTVVAVIITTKIESGLYIYIDNYLYRIASKV